MTTCNNCGRVNDETARICRFCGAVLERTGQQTTGAQVRDYTPPPVSQPVMAQGQHPAAPYGSQSLAGTGYRCPNCQTTLPPLSEKRISTEGWIVFAALLVFCLPLFWVGLLMKEELRVCPACRMRVA